MDRPALFASLLGIATGGLAASFFPDKIQPAGSPATWCVVFMLILIARLLLRIADALEPRKQSPPLR